MGFCIENGSMSSGMLHAKCQYNSAIDGIVIGKEAFTRFKFQTDLGGNSGIETVWQQLAITRLSTLPEGTTGQ